MYPLLEPIDMGVGEVYQKGINQDLLRLKVFVLFF